MAAMAVATAVRVARTAAVLVAASATAMAAMAVATAVRVARTAAVMAAAAMVAEDDAYAVCAYAVCVGDADGVGDASADCGCGSQSTGTINMGRSPLRSRCKLRTASIWAAMPAVPSRGHSPRIPHTQGCKRERSPNSSRRRPREQAALAGG